MSKQDKLYKDAMITAAASNSNEVAEELLSYFVDIGNKECFAAMLYVCFDLLHSDVVEEMSWQHGLNDFYMPYKIQRTRSLVEKVRRAHDDRDGASVLTAARRSQRWRRRSRSVVRRTHKRSSRSRSGQSSTQA